MNSNYDFKKADMSLNDSKEPVDFLGDCAISCFTMALCIELWISTVWH